MDDGACVFGIISDVSAFNEDGEEAHPDGEQRIQAKSMFILIKDSNFFSILLCFTAYFDVKLFNS